MTFERRRLSSPRKPGSNIRVIGFFILLILGFIGYYMIESTGSTLVRSGSYTLTKGSTLSDLPEIFALDIGSTRYKLYLRYFAPPLPNLQSGTYAVDTPTTLDALISKTLSKPTYTDITITILPGWNMYDIDAYLSNKGIVPAGAFLLAARDTFSTLVEKYPFLEGKMSLEGFLYPDTYRILPTADAYMIIDRLLAEWDKKIGSTYRAIEPSSADRTTAYERLILASIVEREERVKSEKPIVADILAKRVREGIAMGADATVCYGYAKTQKQCTPEFIGSVIGIKSAYNTRNKQGYPPTPISSVSLETWEAVLEKKPSEYYYYLHDSDGVIHYARTNAEHVANKQKYLQ